MRLVNEEGVDIQESDVDLMEGYVRAGGLLKEHHDLPARAEAHKSKRDGTL